MTLFSYRSKERLARRAEVMRRVNEFKMRAGCYTCGVKDPVVLLFHHTGIEPKSFTIATAVNQGVTWEQIEKEIHKCIVLCANCHLRLHDAIRKG